MAKSAQKQKPTTTGKPATKTEEAPPQSRDGDKIKAELDELLDEIDEVLEENAAEFVRSYIQKGGE